MLRRHILELVSLALLGSLLLAAIGCHSKDRSLPLKNRFQAELDDLHKQYKFPGATAAYMLPDGTVEVVATGLSDLELGTPMTPHSRMLAASIGKTFVGATVLALVNEGLLDLDEPIGKWIGDQPWFSLLHHRDTITLRHLLTHSSGLADHVSTEAFKSVLHKNIGASTNSLSPHELIRFAVDQPPLFPPGDGWHYTDTGYLIVGLIIERATGRSFYGEVTRRFLAPLHLALTAPSDRIDLPGLSAGYMAPDNPLGLPPKTTQRPGVMAWHPGVEWTGGGFVSNPKDLVVWAQALFNGRALKGRYLDTLLQSVPVSDDDSATRYGVGVAIRDKSPLGPTFGHGGWIPGYCSSLRYYSRHGVAIAFQINTDIGVIDGSTSLVDDMEARLAEVILCAMSKK